MNNGTSTGYVSLERGARQGGPLSLLFVSLYRRHLIYGSQE